MAQPPASPGRLRTSLPLGWYIWFGVVEPISVFAGCTSALFFPANFHNDQVPASYIKRAAAGWAGSKGAKSTAIRAATAGKAASAALSLDAMGPATHMTVAQLGSCYSLIMLNSALMFYAIRRFFSQSPVAQERVLYYLFVVLGAADWVHILVTFFILPLPAGTKGLIDGNLAKLWILITEPSVWNPLLFGNILITLFLFITRAAWWVGIGRDRFFGGEVPEVPSSSKKIK